MVDLSIIVPVYNVELYIRRCLESIYCQNIDECRYEVILVNDGSEDNSMSVINDIVVSHHNITIVNQINQGLSAARNVGLLKSTGKYVLFVDSDDLLIDNSLEEILNISLVNGTDMTVVDFIKLTDLEILDLHDRSSCNEIEPVVSFGRNAFLSLFNPFECYVWRTLFRRDFLISNNLCFIRGLYFEDVPFMTECYLKAQKCVYLNTIMYIYRQHANSIVSTINEKKLLDFNFIIDYLFVIYINEKLTSEEKLKLNDVIYSVFSLVIWYLCHDANLFKQRNTIVEDLRKKRVSLNFTNGIKQIMTSFLFRNFPYVYLRIRYLMNNV